MRTQFLLLFICFQVASGQQKEVSITIDDVPNVALYKRQGFTSHLLDRINTLNIPVAIFINEKQIAANEHTRENREGLATWLKNKNVTAGNHSYSHLNYADTTLAAFREDIIKGEIITSEILQRRPNYFRFPFNSLGKDSAAHRHIEEFLRRRGYVNTPFTVESEDWAFNAVYEEALKSNDTIKARKTGQHYVVHTLLLFDHFEKICDELFGRKIRHIYLCHDNQLNTDYLPELIKGLQTKGYTFITLDKALKDNVYYSTDYYTGRYGFSWIYRWQADETKRKMLMRREPPNEELQLEYTKITNRK